ncbi:MAG TPA: transcriptional regulator [Intrasporangium sp.]|nr:transcriptional regulator [Intrasporangium sp.]
MTGYRSDEATLALHGVRVLGYTSAAKVAALYELATDSTTEHLLDAEARGWVRRTSFGGADGWSMTDSGRAQGERLLSEELDRAGSRGEIREAHAAFRHLNRDLGQVMTQWQVRPTREDALAPNDHRDPSYDDAVVRRLARLVDQTRPITDQLAQALRRLSAHQPRIDHALTRIEKLENAWVDSPTVPSLNIVWIQLHEDLLATLNIPRGSDSL